MSASWYGKSDANFSNYKNAEYDKLYEQLDTEFDEAKRAKIMEICVPLSSLHCFFEY